MLKEVRVQTSSIFATMSHISEYAMVDQLKSLHGMAILAKLIYLDLLEGN